MSKEEKKAYDNLIMLKYFTIEKEDKQSIDIILNLIDKLQKENEELKRKTYKAYINGIGEVEFVFDNYISKDKIRTKIKELEKTKHYITSMYAIGILEELLEE